MNYIIAAYPAHLKSRPEYYSKYTLQIHLYKLFELYSKNPQAFVAKIGQISIGVPKEVIGERIKGYYRKKYWSKKFTVPIVLFPYSESNDFLSYGQWIVAGNLFPTFPFSVLIEDDYYLDSLPCEGEKNTYICSLYANINNHGTHAAISNGIIDTKILTAFSCKDLRKFKNDYLEAQLAFSYMIDSRFTSKSLHEKYNAHFWSSYGKVMRNFSDTPLTENLFLPVEFLTREEIKNIYLSLQNVQVVKNTVGHALDALKLKNNFYLFTNDYELEKFYEKIIPRDKFFECIKKVIKL